MSEHRELINIPEWVSITEAEAAPGEGYWRLTRLKFEDEDVSGGRHHIYIEEPHDITKRGRVRTGNQEFDIILEKPLGEPAGNHPMAGIPNVYTLWMEGGPSDKVHGLQMRGNRHVNYLATYEWRVRAGEPDPGPEPDPEPGPEPDPDPGPAPGDLPALLLARGEAEQRIQFNPGAALQRRIFADGFVPNSPEFGAHHEGVSYIAQRAERLSDGAVRVYYARVGDFANVRFVERGA